MRESFWADRGRQLRLDQAEGQAVTQCVAVSRLGGATAPAQLTLWIQMRGRSWVEAREGRFALHAGDWLILERDSLPQVQADASGLCLGVVPDAQALRLLEELSDRVLYAGRGKLAPRDLRVALRLWREAAAAEGNARAVRPLLLHMVAAQRDLAERVPRCPGRSRSHKRQVFSRLQRARLYLEGNSDRVVRIGELADLTNFSSWYFSKAFHSLYDETPQAVAAGLRLDRAAALLRDTSMMVGEVAAASGFDNCCSFARAFRARFGTSATRYRQQAAVQGKAPRRQRAKAARA